MYSYLNFFADSAYITENYIISILYFYYLLRILFRTLYFRQYFQTYHLNTYNINCKQSNEQKATYCT